MSGYRIPRIDNVIGDREIKFTRVRFSVTIRASRSTAITDLIVTRAVSTTAELVVFFLVYTV